jgi:hypothetical protein
VSRQPREPKGRSTGGEFAKKPSNDAKVVLPFGGDAQVLSDDLRAKLPGDTATTWLTLAPLLPTSAYLVGGTGLTVHLLHRISRDLDFFLEQPEDLAALAIVLENAGNVVFTQRDERTLNLQFNETKVQILDAQSQRQIRPTIRVAGVRVASVEDIMATKLNVITKRGELRDYFDLMAIEQQRQIRVEEGISYAIARYSPSVPREYVRFILPSLGYLGDVEDDDSLPVERSVIESYWIKRRGEIEGHIAGLGES